jgi:cell division protein FtsB
MFELFFEMYGMEILSTILIALCGYLGMQAKIMYERYINTKEKEAVAKTVCAAIEQLYQDLDGEAKKQKALENIEAMLAEKGIAITQLEMEMLIESAVFGFHQGLNSTSAKEEVEQ